MLTTCLEPPPALCVGLGTVPVLVCVLLRLLQPASRAELIAAGRARQRLRTGDSHSAACGDNGETGVEESSGEKIGLLL